MSFQSIAQIYTPPGIVGSAAGTPNFLMDIGAYLTVAQYNDMQQGGLSSAVFQLNKKYESIQNIVPGNWLYFATGGGVITPGQIPNTIPSVRSQRAFSVTTATIPGANLTVTAPVGDVILAVWSFAGGTGVTPTLPTGWNLILRQNNGTANSLVLASFAGDGVTNGWTFTLNSAHAQSIQLLDWQGIDISQLFLQNASTFTSTTTPAMPAMSLLNANSNAIVIYSIPNNTTMLIPSWGGYATQNQTGLSQQVATWLGSNAIGTALTGTMTLGLASTGVAAILQVASKGTFRFSVNSLSDDYGVSDLQVGDFALISDGVNTDLVQISVVSTATGLTANQAVNVGIAYVAAPGVTNPGLKNVYPNGATIARLVYTGIIKSRQRNTALNNQMSINCDGFFSRYTNVNANLDITGQDAATVMSNLANAYSGTLPEIVYNSANFAAPAGFIATVVQNDVAVSTTFSDMLKQENAVVAFGSLYAVWVDASRQIYHKTFATAGAPTVTIDLLTGGTGTRLADKLGPLVNTDGDITGLVNIAIVLGGTKADGTVLRIIVKDDISIAAYGYWENTLTNTALTDETTAAKWAASQLATLAYPSMSAQTSFITTSMRVTSRDLVQITGFEDASVLLVNPVSVSYTIDSTTQRAVATVVLNQLFPNPAQAIMEIANEQSIRIANYPRQPANVGSCFIVAGFDYSTTGGTNVTIGPGTLYMGSTQYFTPTTSFTQTDINVKYAVNVGVLIPVVQKMVAVTGLGPNHGSTVWTTNPAAKTVTLISTPFQGIPLWSVTVLGGVITGHTDLRIFGSYQTGYARNLVPDSDMKYGNMYWPQQLGFTIQSGAGLGGANGCVHTSPPSTGNITDFATTTAAANPVDMVAGADGNLWFTEGKVGAGKIAKITPAGVVTEFASPTIAGQPYSVCSGPDGNLWYTYFNAAKVVKVDISQATPVQTEYTLTGAVNLTYICVGPDGNLWVTENGNLSGGLRIWRVTPAGVATSYATVHAGPFNISSGPDGRLWFTYSISPILSAMDPYTRVITDYTVFTGGSYAINGMCLGPDGNMWCLNFQNSTIGRVTPSGTVTVFGPYGTMGQPLGIATGPDFALWVADFTNKNLYQIDPSTGTLLKTYVALGAGSQNLTTGPDGNMWWCEATASKIGKMIMPNGYQSCIGTQMNLQNSTYTLSAYIDATVATAGTIQVQLRSLDLLTTYATLSQSAGLASRKFVTVALGSIGPTVIFITMNGATMPASSKVIVSNPQVEFGTAMTDYHPNAIDDTSNGFIKSTMLIGQGSLIAASVVPVLLFNDTSVGAVVTITCDWTGGLIYFSNGQVTVIAPSTTSTRYSIGNLAQTHTYYFNAWVNPLTGAMTIQFLGDAAPTNAQNIQPVMDGRVVVSMGKAYLTHGAGGGGGSGTGGGGKLDGCPTPRQIMERINKDTKIEEFVCAGMLRVGDLLRDPVAGWNEIEKLRRIPDVTKKVITTEKDPLYVNQSHGIMTETKGWQPIWNLEPGDNVKKWPNGSMKIVTIEDNDETEFIGIQCRRNRYVAGRTWGHNYTF